MKLFKVGIGIILQKKKQIFNMVSFIIPSHNNLRHLKNVYESIRRNAPTSEVILIDDASTDGTWDWIWQLAESHQHREVKVYQSKKRVGHTILYDVGINMATNDIVGILHADMIIGPNYIENMVKHLKRKTVVCGTRIEPPLHPAGLEKVIQDFGMDFDSLKIPAFEFFCRSEQMKVKDVVTNGMFAPWIIYKQDFQSMGGHDPIFAPFPLEDSDIFQRWILSDYKLIQSRDAFVYHLTCRGHRWTEEVGKDDDYFKIANENASRNYLRKWGSWIRNDEYHHPIIPPVYDIAFKIKNATYQTIYNLEPWCSTILVDGEWNTVNEYLINEQPKTLFNLSNRIKPIEFDLQNDIVVEFDANQLNENSYRYIQSLPYIIYDSGEIGIFQIDIFTITINKLREAQSELANLNNPEYQKKMK